MADGVPPLGQISASLAAMSRTIDDYDSMARREMIKAKQEKATARVQKFRADYSELRKEFEKLKSVNEEQVRLYHGMIIRSADCSPVHFLATDRTVCYVLCICSFDRLHSTSLSFLNGC